MDEIRQWKCDACAESEGGSGLPCMLSSAMLPDDADLLCPVTGEGAEFIPCDDKAAVEKLEADRDELRKILADLMPEYENLNTYYCEREHDSQYMETEAERAAKQALEKTSGRTCENCGDDGCAGYIGTEACWTRKARVGGK